ncbi:MAG: DMT family transporter [Planctomycetes bacterium]|nr:DMT family transporter [Planctomycetota bacterium]
MTQEISKRRRFRLILSTPFDASAMMAIVKLALFASAVAFIFFTYRVRHLGITQSNMFVNMVPVFTALFAWQVLGNTLTTQEIVGIVVVISGLFLAQLNVTRKPKGPDPKPGT